MRLGFILMKTEKRGVEDVLDEYTKGKNIWVIKPKHQGIGSDYKPDQVLILDGFCIGVECKRIMRLSDKSTLPTAGQTHELRELIKAGGAGCAIDINSVHRFIDTLDSLIYGSDILIRPEYKELYCIENWATETKQVKL